MADGDVLEGLGLGLVLEGLGLGSVLLALGVGLGEVVAEAVVDALALGLAALEDALALGLGVALALLTDAAVS